MSRGCGGHPALIVRFWSSAGRSAGGKTRAQSRTWGKRGERPYSSGSPGAKPTCAGLEGKWMRSDPSQKEGPAKFLRTGSAGRGSRSQDAWAGHTSSVPSRCFSISITTSATGAVASIPAPRALSR